MYRIMKCFGIIQAELVCGSALRSIAFECTQVVFMNTMSVRAPAYQIPTIAIAEPSSSPRDKTRPSQSGGSAKHKHRKLANYQKQLSH